MPPKDVNDFNMKLHDGDVIKFQHRSLFSEERFMTHFAGCSVCQSVFNRQFNVACLWFTLNTSFTLLHFAWHRANHCGGTCRQFMSQVGGGIQSAMVVHSTLVVDPTIQLPGFDLHRRQWSLLNRFRTGQAQGHCDACHKKWSFTDSELCDCGEVQTMSHIVNTCPLTKFEGGLLRLHEADEAAVDWLTIHGS